MFKSAIGILSALVLISMTLGAANAQNPVVDALKGCSKEIETYCSSVTPGGGRLVSCANESAGLAFVGVAGDPGKADGIRSHSR